MLKILPVFVLLSLWLQTVYAQHASTVEGAVTSTDGKPAEAVTVNLKNTGIGAITNAKGRYQLNRIKPGTYTIKVSSVGLTSQEKTVTVAANSALTVDFVLSETASQLSEVAVLGNKPKYKVDDPSPSIRLNEPLLQVPQNIQVITGDQIKNQQIFNMMEGVSRNVSGVTMQEHWGNYARLNTRGDRVAPFRNGMNIESNWGPLAEDMAFVDRIEFVKGPAGFMLANGNPSGFYNIVTKKPTGISHQSIQLSYGSFNTYRATADFDGKLTSDGKLLYRLNVAGQSQDSWRPYDYTRRYGIAPVLRYKFDAKNTLTAEVTYQYNKQAVLGSAYLFSTRGYKDLPRNFTFADPNLSPTVIHDYNAFLTYEHQFNDKWKLTAQGAYFQYGQKGSDIWLDSLRNNGDAYRVLYSWDAQDKSKFGQVYVNGEVQTGPVAHRLLGGLDLADRNYLADWNQTFPLDVAGPFNIYRPVYGNLATPQINRSEPLSVRAGGNIVALRYGAIYLQDELRFLDNKLRLTLAGRYTRSRTIQYGDPFKASRFSPRVGLSYSVDKNTSAYAVYDQAFLPQTGVLFGGGTIKPVTGNNMEVGLKRDWFGGKWSTSASFYQITKNNQLIGDPAHPGTVYVIQLGQTETKGVELDARGEIVTGLSLMVNYAHTDSKVSKDPTDAARVGRSVPGFAKDVTNAWLYYRLPQGPLKGLGLSMGYQWQMNRLTWGFAEGEQTDLPDYFRLDGALSYQLNKISIGLNVNNLLNTYLFSGGHENYLNPAGSTVYAWQAEAPRAFRLSLGYRFN